jgi:hypothetical protein
MTEAENKRLYKYFNIVKKFIDKLIPDVATRVQVMYLLGSMARDMVEQHQKNLLIEKANEIINSPNGENG